MECWSKTHNLASLVAWFDYKKGFHVSYIQIMCILLPWSTDELQAKTTITAAIVTMGEVENCPRYIRRAYNL
jgi:hypothetical protein